MPSGRRVDIDITALSPLESPIPEFFPPKTRGVKEDPRAAEIRETLYRYDAPRQEWAEQIVEDALFRDSVMYTQEEIDAMEKAGMFPATVNEIHPAVDQGKSLLTTNKPRFTATAFEDSDVETSRVYADIMSWLWDTSGGNKLLKRVIDDYYVKSLGYMQVDVDPYGDMGKPHIKLQSLSPLHVWVDPASSDPYFRDADCIIVRQLLSADSIRVNFPEYARLLSSAETSRDLKYPGSRLAPQYAQILDVQQLDPDQDYFEVMDSFKRVSEVLNHVNDESQPREYLFKDQEFQKYQRLVSVIETTASGDRIITDEKEAGSIKELMTQTKFDTFHYQFDLQGAPQQVPGPEMSNPDAIQGTERRYRLVMNQELIRIGVITVKRVPQPRVRRTFCIGGQVAFDGILPISRIPIVPLANSHNRNPYCTSDVRKARPVQEQLNKIHQIIMVHSSNAANIKVFYPEGAIDETKFNEQLKKVGTVGIPYNSELGNVIIGQPVPLTSGIFQLEALLRHHIQEIFGIFAIMGGDSTAAPATFKGTMAIEEFGQRRSRSKRDDVEDFINEVGKIVVELIPFVYTDRRVIRLLQPDNLEKKMTINEPIYRQGSLWAFDRINDVTIGRYDIKIVSGSMLPSNRWALNEAYREMYRDGLIDQLEVLKKTELVDIQGVMERFGAMKQMSQQVQQLQATVKQLQGDLQTADREAVHAKKYAELAEWKSRLKMAETDANALVSLFEEALQEGISPRFSGAGEEESSPETETE